MLSFFCDYDGTLSICGVGKPDHSCWLWPLAEVAHCDRYLAKIYCEYVQHKFERVSTENLEGDGHWLDAYWGRLLPVSGHKKTAKTGGCEED